MLCLCPKNGPRLNWVSREVLSADYDYEYVFDNRNQEYMKKNITDE